MTSTRALHFLRLRGTQEIWERFWGLTWTQIFRIQCWWHGIPLGRGAKIYGPVILRAPWSNISFGDNVIIVSDSWRFSVSGVAHASRLRTFNESAKIIVEDGAGFTGISITARSQTVRIRKGAMLGPDIMIVDSDFHQPWPPEERRHYANTDRDRGVDIGENTWIGARSIILKGVTIGRNSVVAAGSVVLDSIPENCLAAGNPAKVIKYYSEGGTS